MQRNILYPIQPNQTPSDRLHESSRARGLESAMLLSLITLLERSQMTSRPGSARFLAAGTRCGSPRRRERENVRDKKRAPSLTRLTRVNREQDIPPDPSENRQVLQSPTPSDSSQGPPQDSLVSLHLPPSTPSHWHLPPTFPRSLTWPVASSCTPDEDFLRKTANYISEMHAV